MLTKGWRAEKEGGQSGATPLSYHNTTLQYMAFLVGKLMYYYFHILLNIHGRICDRASISRPKFWGQNINEL